LILPLSLRIRPIEEVEILGSFPKLKRLALTFC